MWVRISTISAVVLGLTAVGCQSSSDIPLHSSADAPHEEADSRPESRATRGKDEVGQVKVTGGSVDDAPEVAHAMVQSFHRCKLKWSPKSTGEVQVSAKIGPVGEVRIATPEANDPMPPMLVACVRAKVAGAKFAAPTGNDPTVFIPIKFAAD